MDHAPYYVNNAAARGEAAATSQKRVHELSSPSVLPKQTGGTTQILIFETLLMTSRPIVCGLWIKNLRQSSDRFSPHVFYSFSQFSLKYLNISKQLEKDAYNCNHSLASCIAFLLIFRGRNSFVTFSSKQSEKKLHSLSHT